MARYCPKSLEYDCPGIEPGAQPCIYYCRPKDRVEWCMCPLNPRRKMIIVNHLDKCPGRKESGW
jgi:hypothetical protein